MIEELKEVNVNMKFMAEKLIQMIILMIKHLY